MARIRMQIILAWRTADGVGACGWPLANGRGEWGPSLGGHWREVTRLCELEKIASPIPFMRWDGQPDDPVWSDPAAGVAVFADIVRAYDRWYGPPPTTAPAAKWTRPGERLKPSVADREKRLGECILAVLEELEHLRAMGIREFRFAED